ncbi:MAG TPA: class I SAM-dependent methyltransferase [Thermoanaerobaculia bacterium]
MDFDAAAAGYAEEVDRAVAFSGQAQGFFLDVKARQIEEAIRDRLGEPSAVRALEVGCGPGLMQLRLRPHLGRLWGMDLSLGCLAQASQAGQARARPGVQAGGRAGAKARAKEGAQGGARAGEPFRLVAGDGQSAPFAGGSFDLVFAVCVLHHVPPDGRRDALVGEMARLARPGGLVAIWEHNPWNPLTRRAVARCRFDRDAALLSLAETRRLLRRAGLSRIESRYGLFFPWRGRGWRRAERLLAQVPLGAQFVALAIKPPPPGRRDGSPGGGPAPTPAAGSLSPAS